MHGMNDMAALERICKEIIGASVKISDSRYVGGGSISRTMRVDTSAGKFFIKSNEGELAKKMFEAEMNGLAALKRYSQFHIPETYGVTREGSQWFLVMEFLDAAPRSADFSDKLGHCLAEMHRCTAEQYGFKTDNFIGSLLQSNHMLSGWDEFFVSQRMQPMLKMARDRGLVGESFITEFEKSLPHIIAAMPDEPPAFIHGDLWAGNLMTDNLGNPTIIDPAVYFGHREMDLAFTHLFGGFSNRFYDAYNEAYPQQPGFNQRIGIFNLYPLLVHLNLFGPSYLGQITSIISRFT